MGFSVGLKVHPEGANSNSFLEDLKRINQLKDNPFQYDMDENQTQRETASNHDKSSKIKKVRIKL